MNNQFLNNHLAQAVAGSMYFGSTEQLKRQKREKAQKDQSLLEQKERYQDQFVSRTSGLSGDV